MYTPKPIDLNDIELPDELKKLREKLAKHNHDVWAKQRITEGWSWGEKRNDDLKQHPCIVPYEDLPESEKEYDRNTSEDAIKLIILMGFKITSN